MSPSVCPTHVVTFYCSGDCEANTQRITAVEKLFGFPGKRLHTPRRVLVGEGTLTKICKRKPKQSILLQRRSPHFIDLIDTEVADVGDNGIYQNGFSVLNPRKSFTLYATTSDEKLQWIVHLRRCISEARLLAGFIGTPSVKHSPVWIPDSETSSCMACHSTLFTLFQRKVSRFFRTVSFNLT
ncbi:unnamed protein product [Dicrocoelium dendriticum]|nr:unnamed protein product [Dicrocoelium dendriticum]